MNPTTINRLVAERVMGYQFWREQRGDYSMILLVTDGREPWTRRRQECWEQDAKRYQKIAASEIDPKKHVLTDGAKNFNPAADMNQAMEVVDKMHGTGVLVSLEWKVNRYRANFSPVNDWKWRNNAEHLNPATAICLAALAAVGVECKESENG